MRLKRARRIAIAILAILGAVALMAAFFAFELGLGAERKMGGSRVALAYLGGFSLLLAVLLAVSGQIATLFRMIGRQPVMQRIRRAAAWCGQRLSRINHFFEYLEKSRLAIWLENRPAAWAALGSGLVIFVSLWYITSGTLDYLDVLFALF